MRRVIGIDVHRTFGEVAIWDNGVVRHFGRIEVDPTRRTTGTDFLIGSATVPTS